MAIECYDDSCKFHCCNQVKASGWEGPYCYETECRVLPDPPAEIFIDVPQRYEDTLDVAIIKEDLRIAKMKDDEFQMLHGEIPYLTEQAASEIVESMLPHKQILRDRLGDMDTQARMETYGH
jgi:hypothetical protein